QGLACLRGRVSPWQGSPRIRVTSGKRECGRMPTQGSRAGCDSYGGSVFEGKKMGVRAQQWPWFAILVRTGREKTANLLLENSGYECFLPVSRSTRRWSDRTKVIEMPLFPGYLFCRINPHNRLTVLMTPGVIQIVGVGKTPIPVEEEEIEAIQHVQKSGLSAMP